MEILPITGLYSDLERKYCLFSQEKLKVAKGKKSIKTEKEPVTGTVFYLGTMQLQLNMGELIHCHSTAFE